MSFLEWLVALVTYVGSQSHEVLSVLTVLVIVGALGTTAFVDSVVRPIFRAALRRIESSSPITMADLDRRLAEHRRLLLADSRRLLLEAKGGDVEDAEEVVHASPAERPVRRASVAARIRRQVETVLGRMTGNEWDEQRAQLQRLVGTVVPAITTRRREVQRTLTRLRKLVEKHPTNGAAGPGITKTREHVSTLERLSGELDGQLDQVFDSLVGMEAAIVAGREVGAGTPEVADLTGLMDRVEGNARALADALREVERMSPAQT